MLFFFLIGLAIIALGIFALKHSKRMHNLGVTYAVVQDCIPSSQSLGSIQVPCNRLILEVPTAYGVAIKEAYDDCSYQPGDTVKIFYNSTEDTIELCKNVSAQGNKGPYLIIGFGALICAIILFSGIGFFRALDSDSSNTSGKTMSLPLNEDGYSTTHIDMPEDEKYCEYYYVPASTNDSFAYNIRIYHCGVGTVTIFPMESQGKGIQQFYSFYPESSDLKQIKKASKDYDFDQLAESKTASSEGEGILDHEYLYYYNGKDRIGSGGYGVKGDNFDTVTELLKNTVPQEVWDAVKKEIWGYYE